MAQCHNCGAQVAQGAAACPECGAQFANNQGHQQQPQQGQAQQPQGGQPPQQAQPQQMTDGGDDSGAIGALVGVLSIIYSLLNLVLAATFLLGASILGSASDAAQQSGAEGAQQVGQAAGEGLVEAVQETKERECEPDQERLRDRDREDRNLGADQAADIDLPGGDVKREHDDEKGVAQRVRHPGQREDEDASIGSENRHLSCRSSLPDLPVWIPKLRQPSNAFKHRTRQRAGNGIL